jgi:hypothetical protein
MISMSMIRYLAFQMSEVFPEDDPLSEWLITPALAMNDLALVHVRLDEDPEEPDRAFYWNRLAVSHFTEAALFLRDTADVPEVRAFVESLGDEARTKYDECLAIFHEYRGKLFSTRNKATFHYRALRPANPQADQPIRWQQSLRARSAGSMPFPCSGRGCSSARLWAQAEESRELIRSRYEDQRSSRRLPIPSKSIKPEPAPARGILMAPSRTGSSSRRSHARPSSRFAPGAGSWKRPDHGRAGSAS